MNIKIHFGSIAIVVYDTQSVATERATIMLEKPCGEAMEVGEAEIEKLLTEYYDGNF